MNIPFVLKSQLRFEQCQCIINIFITFIVIIIIWLQIVWQNVCPGIVPLNSILWNLRMACFNLRASWLEVILYACECITSWNNDTFVFKKRRVLGTKEKHVFFFPISSSNTFNFGVLHFTVYIQITFSVLLFNWLWLDPKKVIFDVYAYNFLFAIWREFIFISLCF